MKILMKNAAVVEKEAALVAVRISNAAHQASDTGAVRRMQYVVIQKVNA